MLDYNFATIGLHQPAGVSVVQHGLLGTGIVFLCERGKPTFSFADFKGKVKIRTKSLKRRAEFLSHLRALSLKTDGTVPVLRQRLSDHLGAIYKSNECVEHVQIHPKPYAS